MCAEQSTIGMAPEHAARGISPVVTPDMGKDDVAQIGLVSCRAAIDPACRTIRDRCVVPSPAVLQILADRVGKPDDDRLLADSAAFGKGADIATELGKGAATICQNEQRIAFARISGVAVRKTDVDLISTAGSGIGQGYREGIDGVARGIRANGRNSDK